MRFVRYGRTCQLRIEDYRDIISIPDLNDALWTATSAPVSAFDCDPAFAAFMDSDGNGRIRTDEVRAAIQWLQSRISQPEKLHWGAEALALEAVVADVPEGRQLLDGARYVLNAEGRTDAPSIDLPLVRGFLAALTQRPLNGDGIIIPEAAERDELSSFIADVISCTGGTTDACGKPGMSARNLEAFNSAARAFLEWRNKAQAAGDGTTSRVMPLGDATAGAYEVFIRNSDKIDQYFALCRALQFEPNLASHIKSQASHFEGGELISSDRLNAWLERFPLARPREAMELSLEAGMLNPAYRSWIAALKAEVLAPVLGTDRDALSEPEWLRVKEALFPFGAYLAEKQGANVEKLPLETIQGYLDGDFSSRALELIACDSEVAGVLSQVRELERMLLCQKYLLRFLNNFVCFSDLYSPERRAMFEIGSAVIDGRWFNLAIKVDNLAEHAEQARTSNLFTVYLELTRQAADVRRVVALPATSGSRGNLVVGKRGVFLDTGGMEHEARIVRIIENPISVKEALTAPFVRLSTFVVGKIEALSASSEQELQKSTDRLVAEPPARTAPSEAGVTAARSGLLVGLSLSAAAIGSAFAFITKTFAGMSRTQALLGLLGAVVVVMVPVSVIAILKLRSQDLSALLEACGWAINTRMRLTSQQRRQFTRRPPYPQGATGTPPRQWVLFLLLALLVGAVAWLLGRHFCNGLCG